MSMQVIPTWAETLTLWQDDGNGKNISEAHTSIYLGLQGDSVAAVVTDPTDTTHGGVHQFTMNGTNGASTEWGELGVATSPYLIKSRRVWSDRIIPGVTPYSFQGEFYIPSGTTMRGNDVVYLLVRFYSANGSFNEKISVLSAQSKVSDAGGWIQARIDGIIPDVDASGSPIAEIQPLVAISDYSFNAGTGVFAYLDNLKFSVHVRPGVTLPPHPVTLEPTQWDADGNGYPDVWEALYGAYGLIPDHDEDGDGVTNINEALAGTNPFDASSRLELKVDRNNSGGVQLVWPDIKDRPNLIETSTDLGQSDPWVTLDIDSAMIGEDHHAMIDDTSTRRFYRARPTEPDTDLDSVPDWVEGFFGFTSLAGDSDSSREPRAYDTDGDGSPDTVLSGDLASFNEIYVAQDSSRQMTEAQAARLLIQATFGPTYEDIQYLKEIGLQTWFNEQVSLPKSYTSTYISAIKTDYANDTNPNPDPELAGYAASDGNSKFVFGPAFTTAWARAVIMGEDQLRQRVAFALSQILVASRSAAGLGNATQTAAHYYDQFIDEAFGNYEALLNKVSRHPMMGHYLSSLGNQKADPSIGRYPDENYAREIMQLFTIGLWELNLDGTRKLDANYEPIPTYGNFEITELARVFTGTHYAANSFGGGWNDDGFYMTTPMRVFPDQHDFGSKTLVTGHVIPARDPTEANAVQDIEDSVYHLVRHPNTAPFICRQLIQFLVTSNPTPAYVARVAAVFQDNGSGVVGDMEAVVKAILFDSEARNPMNHLGTSYFGHLREPTIRTMHLARVMNLGRFPNLMWWDWGSYRGDSLQDPMGAPTVFNYFRPDFRMRGQLASSSLDSPAFQITDSYAAIAFPNRLWTIASNGFKANNGTTLSYDFPPDWSELVDLAGNVSDLLDRVSLLFCAGTMSADSRDIIATVLTSTNNLTERARLAAYLALISPEGACLK
ncbi:DUF1800 domain-containing protein [Rubellicoccus peritrichatus]|uniref:DUF1800 domain-containing protein n=1 Tax=Rubellicoccus peritrichatus TaxID=3080537 RepID=A0AAQ3LAT3_9BACT|nr:DUF1800 domain-containing protein [Puniceicoccus sp. CR14]WOO42276.1 DUF1800 domain-containing protein [Puniceicoccus sp. CR14]